MVIDPRDYHTFCDNDNRAILEQLAQDSEDTDIANIISCYTIGQADKDIRKQLDKFLVPALKKAATYLGLTVDGEQTRLKKEIITEIILRIETLLKDLCAICGEYYNNKLGDELTLKCLICQQGCHQPCFDQMNTVLAGVSAEMKNSFHFICTSCYSNYSHDNASAPKS